MQRPLGGQEEQIRQRVAKQDACPQAAAVPALIGGAELNHPVRHQRNHQQRRPDCAGMRRPPGKRGQQDSRQLPGTAGAERKLRSFIIKGAIRPAMAAEDNRQPFADPLLGFT